MELKQLTQYTLLKTDKSTTCLNELLGFKQSDLITSELVSIDSKESYVILRLETETILLSICLSDYGIQTHWRAINAIGEIKSLVVRDKEMAFIADGVGYFYSTHSFATFLKYPLKQLIATDTGFVGSHAKGLSSFTLEKDGWHQSL